MKIKRSSAEASPSRIGSRSRSHAPTISEKSLIGHEQQAIALFQVARQRSPRFNDDASMNFKTKNCQVMTSRYPSSLIYILLQLLLISATSSKATSQIRSVWVPSEGTHTRASNYSIALQQQRNRERPLGTKDVATPLTFSSLPSERSPAVDSGPHRRPDFDETSAARSRREGDRRNASNDQQLTRRWNAVTNASGARKNDLSQLASGLLLTSATSLQPVVIVDPDQQGRDMRGSQRRVLPAGGQHASAGDSNQQQAAQRRSSQSYESSDATGGESAAHETINLARQPQFKIANLSDETPASSSFDNFWKMLGGNHPQPQQNQASSSTNTSTGGGVVSNAQVHFDDSEHQAVPGSAQQARHTTSDGRHGNVADLSAEMAPTSNLSRNHETSGSDNLFIGRFDDSAQVAENKSVAGTTPTHTEPFGPVYPVLASNAVDEHDNATPDDHRSGAGALGHRYDGAGPPPPIYYLPDGDSKWADQGQSQAPSRSDDDSVRRQQQQQQQHRFGQSVQFDENRKLQAEPPSWPTGTGEIDSRIQASPPDNQMPVINYGFSPTNHRPGQEQPAYSVDNQHHLQTTAYQVTTTTPMPPQLSYTARDLALTAMRQQQQQRQLLNFNLPTYAPFSQHAPAAAPLYPFASNHYPPSVPSGRRHATPTVLPMSLHHFMSSAGNSDDYDYLVQATASRWANGLIGPSHHHSKRPISRQVAQVRGRSRPGRPINPGESPGLEPAAGVSQRSTGTFQKLRNYSPMQLIAGSSKPKKSLLSSLNDKFSTWSTGSAREADVKHLIESSFYDDDNSQDSQQSGRQRRLPARGIAATSNPYLHLASNRNRFQTVPAPMPLYYGPAVGQPTIAPASSTLAYSPRLHSLPTELLGASALPSGYYPITPATRPRLHNQRAQQNQQQPQAFGSQSSAANFIPVVAVQVTRTSPAPNAQSDSAPTQRQQQQQADLAANEIDQYLMAKTGQLAASSGDREASASSNLNDRQKWDDSHGSTAAATLADYQSQQRASQNHLNQHFYHAPATSASPSTIKSRRRHAPMLASSSGHPPQHHTETTIKGAVFGYLPQQADAPLMQAMSMLQQLPASQQVQHHHHHQSQGHQQVASPQELVTFDSLPLHKGRSSANAAMTPPFARSPDVSAEAYANQVDRLQQSAESPTHQLDYQSLVAIASAAAANQQQLQQQQQQQEAPGLLSMNNAAAAASADMTPMSLALQLQASNYAQNDIAHPFSGPQQVHTLQSQLAGSNNYIRQLNNYANAQLNRGASAISKQPTLDLIYPLQGSGAGVGAGAGVGSASDQQQQQLHYPAFQFMSPSQLGAYQDQLSQLLAASNPLMTADKQHSLSAYQGLTRPGQQQQQQQQQHDPTLASLPNELNPLLMSASPLLFPQSPEALAAFQYQTEDGASSTEQPTTDSSGAGVAAGQESSGGAGEQQQQQSDDDQQQDSTSAAASSSETAHRDRDLSSKTGKKRSGDFFASAGQLLLSALPLLLAPTLGLMFAASPTISAARYPGASGVQLGQASGFPSSGASLDDGLVMNASPMPQLFTPSPPSPGSGGGGGGDSGPGGYAGAPNYAPLSDLSSASFSAPDRATRPNDSLPEGSGQDGILEGGSDQMQSLGSGSAGTAAPAQYGLSKASGGSYYKSSNSLPALIGFRLEGPARNRSSGGQAGGGAHAGKNNRSSPATTQKPFAIIITTSGPGRLNRTSGPESNSDRGPAGVASAGGVGGVNRTIFVLESGESSGGLVVDETTTIAPGETATYSPPDSLQNVSADLHGKGAISRQQVQNATHGNLYEQAADRRSSSQSEAVTTTTTPAPAPTTAARITTTTTRAPPAYDVGYEGADFDAQFATLRKSDARKEPYFTTHAPPPPPPLLQPHTFELKHNNHNKINKYVKDKSHYQYDEMPRPAATSAPGRWSADVHRQDSLVGVARANGSSSGASQIMMTRDDHQTLSKLYPLSSWPSSMTRRKTVSLITSSGNKTFPDSSEQYADSMRSATRNFSVPDSASALANGTAKSSELGHLGELLSKKLGTGSGDQLVRAGHNSASDLETGGAASASNAFRVVYDDEADQTAAYPLSRRHESQVDALVKSGGSSARQKLNKRRLGTPLESSLAQALAAPAARSRPENARGLQRSERLRRRKRSLIIPSLQDDETPRAPVAVADDPTLARQAFAPQQPAAVRATGQVVKLKSKTQKRKKKKKKTTTRRKLSLSRAVQKQQVVELRRQDVGDDFSEAQQLDPHLENQQTTAHNQTHNSVDNLTAALAGGSGDSFNFRSSQQQQVPPVPFAVNATFDDGAIDRAHERNLTESDGGQADHLEALKRDASKSKSAIVTAMITHMANDGADQERGEFGGAYQDSSSNEDLREQLLAKKMLLDRLATRAHAAATSELSHRQQVGGEQDLRSEFHAGGRGRFKPTPVLDYRPYAGSPDQPQHPQNFSATRFMNNRVRAAAAASRRNRQRLDSPFRNNNGHDLMSIEELTEDTKRALAKFGTLLLEDTLEQQVPAGLSDGHEDSLRARSQHYSGNTRKRSLGSTGTSRRRYSDVNDQNYEAASATERYSTRATQAPALESWSHGHHDAGESGRSEHRAPHNFTRFPPIEGYAAGEEPRLPSGQPRHLSGRTEHGNQLTYQYPPARGRLSSANSSQTAEHDAHYEHFDSTRTQSGSQRAPDRASNSAGDSDQGHSASRQHELGGASQAVAFKTQGTTSGGPESRLQSSGGHADGSPISRYNSFLASHLSANRTLAGRNSSSAAANGIGANEQLEARYSTYSNYSTAAPAYNHEHPRDDGYHRDAYPQHYERYDTNRRTQHAYHDERQAAPPPPPPPYNSHDDLGGPGAPRSPAAYSSYPQDNNYYQSNQSSSYPSQYYRPAPPADHHHQVNSALEDYSPPPRYHTSQPRSYESGSGPAAPPRSSFQSEHHASPERYYAPPSAGPYHAPNNYHLQAYTPPPHNNPHPYGHQHQYSSTTYAPAASSNQIFGERAAPPPFRPFGAPGPHGNQYERPPGSQQGAPSEPTKAVSDYLKRVQFSDSDRDKLMASYLTCDGLLSDSDHCLERLSCEFSDPQNIEKANKLDRAVSSILLGHILINTYIPNAFKLRLKSASLYGYTQSGKCSKFACSKLAGKQPESPPPSTTASNLSGEETKATKGTVL